MIYGKVGGEVNELWKIMRASLSKSALLSEQEKEGLGEKVVLEMNRISSQSVQKHLDGKIHSSQRGNWITEECVKKVERVIKEYKEALEKKTDCQLWKEELIDVYFKRLTYFVEERIEMTRRKIKKKERFKFHKKGERCEELLSMLGLFHQDIELLQSFALNHLDQSICLYKKQEAAGSKKGEQMDRYDFGRAVKKEKTGGIMGTVWEVALCLF